jgi:hypothetical protein
MDQKKKFISLLGNEESFCYLRLWRLQTQNWPKSIFGKTILIQEHKLKSMDDLFIYFSITFYTRKFQLQIKYTNRKIRWFL